jgi:hypothetical protein
VKIHTLLDLRGSIPSFIHTTGTVAGQIREINWDLVIPSTIAA